MAGKVLDVVDCEPRPQRVHSIVGLWDAIQVAKQNAEKAFVIKRFC